MRTHFCFPENSPCPETQNKMVSSSKGVKVMVCSGCQPINYMPTYPGPMIVVYPVLLDTTGATMAIGGLTLLPEGRVME